MLSMLEKGLEEEHVTLLIDTQELIIKNMKDYYKNKQSLTPHHRKGQISSQIFAFSQYLESCGRY